MDWQDNLTQALNSPLFALGTGMLAAAGPHVGAPVGFGQALNVGMQSMQAAQQAQQDAALRKQRASLIGAQLLQQQVASVRAQQQAQRQAAFESAYKKAHPDMSAAQTYSLESDPGTFAQNAAKSPWMPAKNGLGEVNPITGQFRPYTVAQPQATVQVPDGQPPMRDDAMAPYLRQANQAIQMGADPDKVESWLKQQGEHVSQQAQGNTGPQTLADWTAAHGPKPQPSALQQKVAIARALGATDDQLKQMVLGGGGGIFGDVNTNSFTPEAQKLLAVATEQGLKIPIPSVGMGGAARVQFVNGLAKDIHEKHLPLDLALQEMRFGLDADPALKASQKLYSTTKTLEAGADAMAQQALDLSGTVSRGQIPLFNAWVNAGRRATGDPKIARFDRAINAFVKDYAKVVSGSLGSSAASDSEIKSAERQLRASNNPEEFAANVDQMRTEMRKRTEAMLGSIRHQVANLSNGGRPNGAPQFGRQDTSIPSPTVATSSRPGDKYLQSVTNGQ